MSKTSGKQLAGQTSGAPPSGSSGYSTQRLVLAKAVTRIAATGLTAGPVPSRSRADPDRVLPHIQYAAREPSVDRSFPGQISQSYSTARGAAVEPFRAGADREA